MGFEWELFVVALVSILDPNYGYTRSSCSSRLHMAGGKKKNELGLNPIGAKFRVIKWGWVEDRSEGV